MVPRKRSAKVCGDPSDFRAPAIFQGVIPSAPVCRLPPWLRLEIRPECAALCVPARNRILAFRAPQGPGKSLESDKIFPGCPSVVRMRDRRFVILIKRLPREEHDEGRRVLCPTFVTFDE